MCTKSIKLHRLLLLDLGLYASQAMDALHLPLYQFHQRPTIGVPLYCILKDLVRFLAKMPRGLGLKDVFGPRWALVQQINSFKGYTYLSLSKPHKFINSLINIVVKHS